LRLNTARARVAAMRDGGGGGARGGGGGGGVSVRLDASVRGLGPGFKIVVSLVNVGTRALNDVSLLFVAEPRDAYVLQRGQKHFASLLPGVLRTCETGVTCLDQSLAGAASAAGLVRVYVCDPLSANPVVSAVVRVPVPEFL
jgi:hypothetical protein